MWCLPSLPSPSRPFAPRSISIYLKRSKEPDGRDDAPLSTRSLMALSEPRARESLDLPPVFQGLTLGADGDAFAYACRVAGEMGAGTLVWTTREDLADFAVVLEPEAPLSEARKSFFLGMNALLQAISVHCPPERPVSFDWPCTVRFDGGLVGGGRLAWPEDCAEGEVPDWMVFGASVRIAFSEMTEPGQAPDATALAEEGFEGVGPSVIVESFARFFLRQVDLWQSAGEGQAIADYLGHLAPAGRGRTATLSPAGDLNLGGQSFSLVEGLRAVDWLDARSGEPRL